MKSKLTNYLLGLVITTSIGFMGWVGSTLVELKVCIAKIETTVKQLEQNKLKDMKTFAYEDRSGNKEAILRRQDEWDDDNLYR